MTQPKFPSEEQGGYDPIPTHPEPLSPQRNTVKPEEPDTDDIPDDEKGKPINPENPDA
ncbi:hypothetical protein [Pseudomonas frederiksbergensis]|uniref:hypothetical protein n=1 Tax=Pseudomonas frederiksbergensis TaxID=104087 RepID=UPI00161D485D|nr:hypothetical protein [Pseudomonas frederiksbergensis]